MPIYRATTASGGGGGGSSSVTASLEGLGSSTVSIPVDSTSARAYRLDFYIDIHAEDDSTTSKNYALTFNNDTTSGHYTYRIRYDEGDATPAVTSQADQGLTTKMLLNPSSARHIYGTLLIVLPVYDVAEGASDLAQVAVTGNYAYRSAGGAFSTAEIIGKYSEAVAITGVQLIPLSGSVPITGGWYNLTKLY